MRRVPPSPRKLLSWLLTWLALVGAARAYGISTEVRAGDFVQFWIVGQAVAEGLVGDVYAPAARRHLANVSVGRATESGSEAQRIAVGLDRREVEVASTPFLYAVFFAFQTGRYDRDVSRYRALAAAAYVSSVALLCSLLRAEPLAAAGALAFSTWAWVPFGEDLADGNVNQIQLALLALFLALARRAGTARTVAAGAVLGLANAFKPNLAWVLLALTLGWLLDRAWRRLLACWAGALFGAGVAVALSTLLFGSLRPWLDWLAVILAIDRHYELSVSDGNFGGARLLRESLGLGFEPTWLLQLVGWSGPLAALLPGRGPRDPEAAFRREYLLVAAGALLPILTTSLAWPHYLVLALPMLVYALFAPTPARADPRCLAAALGAVLGVLAFFPYAGWGLGGPWLHAATRALVAALLFGVAVAEIRRTG